MRAQLDASGDVDTTMDAFLTSSLLVAIAEIGDKTQLLSFVLAARLRAPLAIIGGIFVATVANHALAGSVGAWVATMLEPDTLRWVVGIGFIAFGIWALKPDTLEGEPGASRWGPFVTATVAFFVAEMGDKTQLATVALAARFDALTAVVVGTTLGMMIANVPAVIIGSRLADRLPLGVIRWIAAGGFVATGLWTLLPR